MTALSALALLDAAHLIAIATAIRAHRLWASDQARLAREIQQLEAVAQMLSEGKAGRPRAAEATRDLAALRRERQDARAAELLAGWAALSAAHPETLPPLGDHGDRLEWLALHHVPGHFPYTNGTARPLVAATPRPAATLEQAFDIVEAGLAQGRSVDEVAPQVVLALPPGTPAEQRTAAGVARRIWAIAMRDHYGAGAPAQQLALDPAPPGAPWVDARAADRLEATLLAGFDPAAAD